MTEEEWKKLTEEYDQINDSFKLEEKNNIKIQGIPELSEDELYDLSVNIITKNNYIEEDEEEMESFFALIKEELNKKSVK